MRTISTPACGLFALSPRSLLRAYGRVGFLRVLLLSVLVGDSAAYGCVNRGAGGVGGAGGSGPRGSGRLSPRPGGGPRGTVGRSPGGRGWGSGRGSLRGCGGAGGGGGSPGGGFSPRAPPKGGPRRSAGRAGCDRRGRG